MEDVSKREASRIVSVWDCILGLVAGSKEHGVLIPVSLAAKSLNVSRTRVDELIADGKLQRVDVYDHVFVGSNSLALYARSPRLPGRPRKPAQTCPK